MALDGQLVHIANLINCSSIGNGELPVEQQELGIGPLPVSGEPNWRELHVKAIRVFRPATPVDVLDVFAGRSREITRICDVVMQPGQHAILFGERGVGKTSLANLLSEFLAIDPDGQDAPSVISPRVNCDGDDTFNSVWRKAFERIELSRTLQPIGYSAEETDESFHATSLLGPEYQIGGPETQDVTPDAVRRVLTRLGKQTIPIIVIDEFDRLAPGPRRAVADLIKMLSDHAVPATVVLVGVADSIDGLLQDHESVSRALVQVHMPRMPRNEIQQILTGGTQKLGMAIDADAVFRVSAIAQGLPHYAHLLGLHASRAAIEERTLRITTAHVHEAVRRAVRDTHHSTVKAYHEAVRSAHKVSLFPDVLLACALAQCDDLGYFAAADVRPPLRKITGRNIEIPNFAQHLNEFSDEKRGRILQMTGSARLYRYRFRDPLMQPYVIMQGEVSGRLPQEFFSRQTS